MTDKRIPALQKKAQSTGHLNGTFTGGPLKSFETNDVSLRYFPGLPEVGIPASWVVNGKSEPQDGFYVGFTFTFNEGVTDGEHTLPSEKLEVYCLRLPVGGGLFYEYNAINGHITFTFDEQAKRIEGRTSCDLEGSGAPPFKLNADFKIEGFDAVFHRPRRPRSQA